MATQDLVRVVRLVDAQASARQNIVERLGLALLRLWRQMDQKDRYSNTTVEAFAKQAAALSRVAQSTVTGSTNAYLRQVLADLDASPSRAKVRTPQQIRGIDPVEVYQRPVREYRRLRVQGLDELVASARAEQRLQSLGDTDLALATRDTTRQVLASADKVTGYRRVIHPELATLSSARNGLAPPPVCGLCLVASDRIYGKSTLMPLHANCRCEALPIVKGKPDPGRNLNQESLAQIYTSAGSTGAEDLKRVRFVVHEHGELGPVLAVAGQDFRGPADVAAASAA